MRFKTFIILALAALVGWKAFGANWYVDNKVVGGARDGSSWANAWISDDEINWSAIGRTTGDVIYFSGGPSGATNDFGEPITIGRGGGSNPITISVGMDEGHNGYLLTRAINNGSYTNLIYIGGSGTNDIRWEAKADTYQSFFTSGSSRYLSINYIRFSEAGMKQNDGRSDCHGILLRGTVEGVVINGCHVYNVWQDGINAGSIGFAAHATNLIVRDTIIERYGDDGIHLNRCATIDGNTIRYKVGGRGAGHSDGIQGVGPWLTIRNNRIYDSGSQGIFIETTEGNGVSREVWIYNNLVYLVAGTNQKLILLKAKQANGQQVGVWTGWYNFGVLNNTLGNVATGEAIRVARDETYVTNFVVTNLLVVNNIVFDVYSNSPASSAVNVGDINWSQSENYRFDTNIVSGTNKRISFAGTYNTGEDFNASAIGDGNSSVMPTFVDRADQDFRLAAGSAGIGAGHDFSAIFSHDHDRNERIAWDIGAYAKVEPTPAPEPIPEPIPEPEPTPIPEPTPEPIPVPNDEPPPKVKRGKKWLLLEWN